MLVCAVQFIGFLMSREKSAEKEWKNVKTKSLHTMTPCVVISKGS